MTSLKSATHWIRMPLSTGHIVTNLNQITYLMSDHVSQIPALKCFFDIQTNQKPSHLPDCCRLIKPNQFGRGWSSTTVDVRHLNLKNIYCFLFTLIHLVNIIATEGTLLRSNIETLVSDGKYVFFSYLNSLIFLKWCNSLFLILVFKIQNLHIYYFCLITSFFAKQSNIESVITNTVLFTFTSAICWMATFSFFLIICWSGSTVISRCIFFLTNSVVLQYY